MELLGDAAEVEHHGRDGAVARLAAALRRTRARRPRAVPLFGLAMSLQHIGYYNTLVIITCYML